MQFLELSEFIDNKYGQALYDIKNMCFILLNGERLSLTQAYELYRKEV